MDTEEIKPELKGLLGVIGLAPFGFALMAALVHFDTLEGTAFGVALFLIGVAVFLGAVFVSKKFSMRAARLLATVGLVVLFAGGVALLLAFRRWMP